MEYIKYKNEIYRAIDADYKYREDIKKGLIDLVKKTTQVYKKAEAAPFLDKRTARVQSSLRKMLPELNDLIQRLSKP